MAVIVQRRLLAAQHHQGIERAGTGQGAVGPGAVDVNQRRRLVQRHAKLAVMRDPGVLDDGDARFLGRPVDQDVLHGVGMEAIRS